MEHSPVGIVFQKEHIKTLQGLSEQNNGEVVWTKSTDRTNNDLRQIPSLQGSDAHL